MRIRAKRQNSGLHESAISTSTSSPQEQYQALEGIAANNTVFLASVVVTRSTATCYPSEIFSRVAPTSKPRSNE